MKIVVATTQGGLDDQVAPTFGRTPTFAPTPSMSQLNTPASC